MYCIENEANILRPTLTWKNCIYMYSMCKIWGEISIFSFKNNLFTVKNHERMA
jgi:hypothetical protein